MRRVAIIAAFVVAASCSDSNDPAAPSVRGEWSGTIASQSVDLSLTENRGDVGGVALFDKLGTNPATVTVTGSQDGANVSFGWNAGDVRMRFGGRIDGVILRGVLNGGGYFGDSLLFSRKS